MVTSVTLAAGALGLLRRHRRSGTSPTLGSSVLSNSTPSILSEYGIALGDVAVWEDGKECWITGAIVLEDTVPRYALGFDHLRKTAWIFETRRGRVRRGERIELSASEVDTWRLLPQSIEWQGGILDRRARWPLRARGEGDSEGWKDSRVFVALYGREERWLVVTRDEEAILFELSAPSFDVFPGRAALSESSGQGSPP